MVHRSLAEHISDAGWPTYSMQLEYKADRYGRTVAKAVPKYAPQGGVGGCQQEAQKFTGFGVSLFISKFSLFSYGEKHIFAARTMISGPDI